MAEGGGGVDDDNDSDGSVTVGGSVDINVAENAGLKWPEFASICMLLWKLKKSAKVPTKLAMLTLFRLTKFMCTLTGKWML